MLPGQISKLSLAALKDIINLETTVSDALLPSSGIPLTVHANPALKATSSIQSLKDATALFHALNQDQLTQPPTNASAQLTQEELKEFGIQDVKNANAHHVYHYGMDNIVLYAHQTQTSIQKKDNATTAQKDSSEITIHTVAYPD